MPSEFIIAIIAGIGGMLGWGLADFFAKKTIDELGDVMTLAWAGVFGSLAFFVAAAYSVVVHGAPVDIPQSPQTWAVLAFLGALQAAVYIFAYRGFGKGQVGLLSPVFATFAGIVALVSILFFGEETNALRLGTLAIMFVGILVLNADFTAISSFKLGRTKIGGFGDIVVATILGAIWTILWERFVSGEDWLFYALYMFVFMTIAVFIFAYSRGMKFGVHSSRLWIFLGLIGICEMVAYIAITLGYGATRYVSVVAILSGAFSLPTIVLARVFLKERTTMTQTLGTIIILAGVVLLSVV